MQTFLFVVAIVGFLIYVVFKAADQPISENPDKQIICTHCQVRGTVRTRPVRLKKGISGGKVMGGLLTGGTSLLATGLSRKEPATEAHCSNCNSTWHF